MEYRGKEREEKGKGGGKGGEGREKGEGPAPLQYFGLEPAPASGNALRAKREIELEPSASKFHPILDYDKQNRTIGPNCLTGRTCTGRA